MANLTPPALHSIADHVQGTLHQHGTQPRQLVQQDMLNYGVLLLSVSQKTIVKFVSCHELVMNSRQTI